MGTREELQSKLEEMLGSRNVYFQPPESKKMEYDAIKYSLKRITKRYASNSMYSRMNCYELIVIARKVNHPVITLLLQLPYCSHDRHYVADNLNHDVFTLYF